MKQIVIGKKVKMDQIFTDEKIVPVTLVNIDNPAAVEDFKAGERVKISGISKGKGFQGVVKRHGFHGGPKTHGQKNRLRAPGSIGTTDPQRVFPGRKMAGRMGSQKIALKRVLVVDWSKETGILALKGALPGAPGGKIKIYLPENKK